MHRRGFLAAGLATVLVSERAVAQMKMDDMPGMDMGGHAGHMGAAPQGAPVLPEGEALRDLPRLANEASTPGLFKATLTAQSATVRFAEELDTPILAYNGTSPGPLIEAAEGDRVEITFVNRIADEASTIHWHGMPVPADQDGNPMDPVATGTDRTYSFDLPEGSAGSYWYHPHPHGKTAEQVYRGGVLMAENGRVIVEKPPLRPLRSVFGRASFTFIARPFNSVPFKREIAVSASRRSVISTNANPRACPVSRSVTILTRSTAPYWLNAAIRSSCVV